MKVLSIKQPWASLIASGIKDIENRTWKTNFRGRILIHASGNPAGSFFQILSKQQLESIKPSWLIEVLKKGERSAIIGEVDIVDCVINHSSIWAEKIHKQPFCRDCADEGGVCPNSGKPCDEKVKPIYNWVLSNPVLYDPPILNIKGKQSFWQYNPSRLAEAEEVALTNKFLK